MDIEQDKSTEGTMATGEKMMAGMDVSVLELLDEPGFVVDQKRTITWANPAFFEAFGLEAAQVIGKMTCEETCNLHLCGTKDCPVEKAGRMHKPVSAEAIQNNGAGLRYYRSLARPMNGGSGQTLVTMTDISDKKQLEARLRQMETDLNVIPTPIMEIDDKFTVTFMNPAGAAVAGLTPDEAVGRKCYDLFKTPHCKTEKCACARAMKTDSVVTEQTIARPRDGVIVPIKYTGAPIKDAKGNIIGALEYVLDVTEESKAAADGRGEDRKSQHHPDADHGDRHRFHHHLHESGRCRDCRPDAGRGGGQKVLRPVQDAALQDREMRLLPGDEDRFGGHRADHCPAEGGGDHPDQVHRRTDQGRQGQHQGRARICARCHRRGEAAADGRREDRESQYHPYADHVDRYRFHHHLHESGWGGHCRADAGRGGGQEVL